MTTNYGDITFYQWGGFDWGEFADVLIGRFEVDLVAFAVPELPFDVDVISKITVDLAFIIDVLAQKTFDRRFDADVFSARLPTDKFNARVTRPIVLVEINFPSGLERIAVADLTAAGFGWEGRLLNAGEIERSLGARTDSMAIRMADPKPDGSRISDGFSFATPPETTLVVVYVLALDDPNENLIEVFRGRVEQVTAIDATAPTLALEVVREDAILDRTVGRRLTTTLAPNAPDEALGEMIPIVFGEVDESEGLVTDFNAISALDGSIFATGTTIRLRDGSRFPLAASATLDDEEVAWTGRTGNILTGVSRGQSGTEAIDHPSGTRVIQTGIFEVQFADHAVTFLSGIKILDGEGNLATPDPLPVLDAATAKATFSRTPSVQSVSRSVDVIAIGLDGFDVAAGNPGGSAGTPNAVLREAPGYTDVNFASITPGQRLEVFRSTPIEGTGEIIRAALLVVHDPAGAQGIGVQVVNDGPLALVGSTSPNDNIPAWAVRRIERQFRTTAYALADPQHNHSSLETVRVGRPTFTISPPAGTPGNPVGVNRSQWFDNRNTFDSNVGSVSYMIDYQNLGGAAPRMVVGGISLSVGAGTIATRGRVGFWFGGQAGTGFPSHKGSFRIEVRGPGIRLTGQYTLFGVPVDQPTLRFGSFSGSVTNDPNAWANATVTVIPLGWKNAGVGNRATYLIREIFIELATNPDIIPASTGLTTRLSVMNFFDVTGIVGGDISFFADRVRNEVRLHGFNVAGEARIFAIYYILEMRPLETRIVEVPRVFTDIRGLEQPGRPTKILESVLTSAPPLGLGRTIDVVSQGAYSRSASSLALDGVRLDFAIHSPVSGRRLLAEIAENADLRQWWDRGQHFVARKPDPTNLDAVFRDVIQADVIRDSLGRSRTPVGEVANEIEASYRASRRVSGLTRVEVQEDAASKAVFGDLREELDLRLIRDDATAAIVVSRRLARAKDPHFIVSFRLPLFALELRRADLISLAHLLFSFPKAEIVALPILVGEFVAVEVSCIVWEE